MINLESSRWGELNDAYGPATKIPELLKQLRSNPSKSKDYKDEPWFSLWSALCHQGDIYTASYAAVPCVVQIGIEAKQDIDENFFFLPREIELVRISGKGPQVPEDLMDDYINALLSLGQIKSALKIREGYSESMSKTMDDEKGQCKQCGHLFDPHLLIAIHRGDPAKGGIMFCPEEGCPCFNTWDLGKKP